VAESPSFKRYEQKGITLGTQQFLTVHAKLEIGNVTQSVTVNEDVNFFNDAAGVPLPAQWNYTYALALGGRVWIPKLYDDHDECGNLNINALNPSYFGLGYDALTTSVPNPLHGAVSSSSNFGGSTV
jgi:hypothetical protein